MKIDKAFKSWWAKHYKFGWFRSSAKEPCNRCGKEMESSDGTGLFALSVTIHTQTMNPAYIAFAQKQMGEYKLDKKYVICFECWLKSVGMKP